MTSWNRASFKVVLLGDTSTGKTCLAKRYFKDQYCENQRPTISAAFESRVFSVRSGLEVQMNVWDTSGEEKYRSIANLYYRDAYAAILCYDVTLEKSFLTLNYWMKELKKVEQDCRIYMCGTKSDLLETFEATPQLSFAESYAQEHAAKFFLTSSKTGENVAAVFEEILKDFIALKCNEDDAISTDSIRLTNCIKPNKNKTKKCCPS